MSQAALKQVRIDSTTVKSTLQTMREYGSHGWEVLVLWLGHVQPQERTAHVTVAYVPKQNPIASEDGVGYFVTGDTLFQLNRELSNTGLRLIAQVHSHPREAFHSEADDRYAIVTADGGLSLVVPDFGHAPPGPTNWAVYRLHGRQWRALSKAETGMLFTVEDVP